MCEHNLRTFSCQCGSSEKVRSKCLIDWVLCEPSFLLLESDGNALGVENVLLVSVLHTNVSQSQWYFLAGKHLLSVSSSIHNIDLGDNTQGSDTLGVELLRKLESVGGGDIGVSRDNTKNDRSNVLSVSSTHALRDFLNVLVLVGPLHWNSGNTGEIDQGEIRTSVRIDVEDDGDVNDGTISSSNLVS